MNILSRAAAFKVIILSAGRGKRMGSLTDTLPKPLLRVGNKSLIEHHLCNLANAGFIDIIINHAYLGQMIETVLGDGKRYGVRILYSRELVALETAGGIVRALSVLNNEVYQESSELPFLVINADIYCEIDFSALLPTLEAMEINLGENLAHLVLVNNPNHHPDGDFVLNANQVTLTGMKKLTFSGIGVYRPEFFRDVIPGSVTKLAPLLFQAIAAGKVSGQHYSGMWIDVGTPERLNQLDVELINTQKK